MSANMPMIFISAAASDHPFVHSLSIRLQTRGLYLTTGAELNPATPPAEIGRAISQCALFFVAISAAGVASPIVRQEYQYALSLGKPVVPIIIARRVTLPPDLQPVQWVDYRGSDEDGWRDMLVALATAGIARFPAPRPPTLDTEVVLAQSLAGRISPDWTVYRRFVRGSRKILGSAVAGGGTIFILTAITAIVIGFGPLVLFHDVIIGIVVFLRFSPRRLTQEKRGEMLIVTPEGVIFHQRGGDIACSFHDIAAITQVAESIAGTTTLTITPTGGRPSYSVAISWRFSLTAAIAEQIIMLHRAYINRYITAMPASPPPPPASLIFISHARKDAAFVDIMELGLQQRGLKPWVDRTMLFGGQQWPAELRQAIERCAALVVVVTPAAVASAAVQREYMYALQLGKPVIAVLATTTGTVPPLLQSLIRADYRRSDIRGLMELNVALDDLGIKPSLPTDMFQLDSTLIVARAYQGRVPPGGRVYKGGIPRRMIAASLYVAFFSLVVGPLVYLSTRWPVILFDEPIFLLGIGIPFVHAMWQKVRLPELIITLPEGVVSFQRNRPIEAPFAYLSASADRHDFWSSRVLITPKSSRRRYVMKIPGHFREHRQNAEQIVTDYQRYANQYANANHPAVPMRR